MANENMTIEEWNWDVNRTAFELTKLYYALSPSSDHPRKSSDVAKTFEQFRNVIDPPLGGDETE